MKAAKLVPEGASQTNYKLIVAAPVPPALGAPAVAAAVEDEKYLWRLFSVCPSPILSS